MSRILRPRFHRETAIIIAVNFTAINIILFSTLNVYKIYPILKSKNIENSLKNMYLELEMVFLKGLAFFLSF